MEAYNLLDEKFINRHLYDELFKELDKFEFDNSFVLISPNREKLPRTKKKPVIFLVGDESHSGDCWKLLDYSELIFKNFAPMRPIKGIVPLPIPARYGLVGEPLDISQRPVDYCLLGCYNTGISSTLIDYYENHNSNGYIKHSIYNDYSILKETKICICPPGHSPETFRYTEAAMAGCVIICPRRPGFWYYQNKYEFSIPDWNFLPELIERILQLTNEDLDLIGRTTQEYYNSFLSPKALALHIKGFIDKHNEIL